MWGGARSGWIPGGARAGGAVCALVAVNVEGPPPVRLVLRGRVLVLIAGLPGAGKSTLLRAVSATGPGAGWLVLDADSVREGWRARLPDRIPYRCYRPLIHLWHRARIVAAALGPTQTVVVHLPAPGRLTRFWVAAMATGCRRSAHLLWVDATVCQAHRGQRARGRTLGVRSFRRHARRGGAFAARLRAGHRPRGWHSAGLLERGRARFGLILIRE